MTAGRKRDPVERKRHLEAFEVYRDLGHGRSYRETARRIRASADSVCKWAKQFDWEQRIQEYKTDLAQKEQAGALVKLEGPVGRKLMRVMDQVEALINSAFVSGTGGDYTPIVKIKSMDELTRALAEYRKFLETYQEFAEKHLAKPPDPKSPTSKINKLNVYLGSVSQEERIAFLKGVANGDVAGGDSPAPRGDEEADYTDVPEPGDEDGPGRGGVPGGAPSGEGGDETHM